MTRRTLRIWTLVAIVWALILVIWGSALIVKAEAATPSVTVRQWTPCANDEAEGGPCVWDHRHMGNGIGRSFKLTATNRIVFITHWQAHRLLNTHWI